MAYADINLDGKLDIIAASDLGLVWLQQPQNIDSDGSSQDRMPDPASITGIITADINADGRIDVLPGAIAEDHESLKMLASMSPWPTGVV